MLFSKRRVCAKSIILMIKYSCVKVPLEVAELLFVVFSFALWFVAAKLGATPL